MNGQKWTRRTTGGIAGLLQQMGFDISANTVARLLYKMDYSLRVNHKKLSTDHSPDRDLQFQYIGSQRSRFRLRGLPIISVDAKKRELVGNFKNPGTGWSRSSRLVNDHDFPSDAIGVAISYGIYDLLANCGSIYVGVSHGTPAFAAHSIAAWWQRGGSHRHPTATELLILADTGGGNSCRFYAWKTEIQSQVCNRFGLKVTVAHYPTGASKWNPIEHRLFSEISKHWAGEPLDSYQKILNLIRSTTTKTGLTVTAYLDRRHYPTGLSPDQEEIRQLRIQPHRVLPKWNYTITPNV